MTRKAFLLSLSLVVSEPAIHAIVQVFIAISCDKLDFIVAYGAKAREELALLEYLEAAIQGLGLNAKTGAN